MNKKSKILSVSGILILFSISSVYAEQVPGAVLAVETNPFYFSEGGLGIGILKFFERPLTPYLVPGKTTEQSSTQEVYEAYVENSKNIVQTAIVGDEDRATVFVVEFFNGELKTPLIFNTFTKFNHIAKDIPADVPYYYQNIQYGLELESLPSPDKQQFYDLLVKPTINPGKKPEPFDINVKFLTGGGDTLQIWEYQDCTINSYTPYLDENLAKIKFVGAFISEMRDKTSFDCGGFAQDFVLKETLKKSDTPLVQILPEKEGRVNRIIVQFSGGEFQVTSSYYTFSKFLPLAKDPEIPISIPGNVIGEKSRFLLESLPTKDKEGYYQQISRYINPGKEPEPFDTTIHLVTNDGAVLQTWKYSDCVANNYSAFFIDNLFFYKFKQKFGSEIRDKTFFECSGLEFNPEDVETVKTDVLFVPDDYLRAQVFSVRLEGPDIAPAKTLTSFTKFSPISHEEMTLLLADAPFDETPKFYLSSLPSKDNEWYYQLMSRYINAGKLPEPFDVTVDVLLGDGTKIQSWKYSDCEVLEFKPFLEDSLAIRKFTNKFEPELRDRTIFQCVGFEFDGKSYASDKVFEKPLDYVDFIPSDDSRVKSVVATFSGEDIPQTFRIHTIGKFQPKMEQRHQTETLVMGLNVAIVPDIESGEPKPEQPIVLPPSEPQEPGASGSSFTVHIDKPHLYKMQKNEYIKSTEFSIESLPSKDKMQYYDLVARYINPGKKPEPFDVKFDLITGDGTILQSWHYADCSLKDFRVKFRDNLLFFAMSGLKGAADIADLSTFSCNGFYVNAEQRKPDYDTNVVSTPSSYDRGMLHLVHWYGGELEGQRSTALIQEFESLPESNLFLAGLPSAYHKDYYEFISRYVNPEKPPEPIDMRVDTVTGDGTILFSTTYADCTVKDAATYLIDGMVILRYVPGLKFEIRGQSVIDCVGTNLKTLPQKDPRFDIVGNLKKLSPVVQTAIGVPSDAVVCNDGFTLMIRPPKNIPLCVKSDHVSEFEGRGWKIASPTDEKLIDVLRPILLSESERATSFTVGFEGSDISPTQTVKTFSKFVPIEDENSVIQKPSNPLNPTKVAFYLESLPSKDKTWYYEFVSRYVNPGPTPEKFNVSVQVKDGVGNELQNWQYRECDLVNFITYYDDALLKYKFHEKWQSEFKDKSVFSCGGFSIT
jgi:hypothetical protein